MKISNVVKNAVAEGLVLQFEYANKGKNAVGVRRVQPVELISGGNVLVAIDLDKDGYRRFALDNMSKVEVD